MNEITFRGDREKLDLADLKTMTIWHDGQGFMADWVLERICLTDCLTGKKFDFVFCEEYKFDKIKKNNRYFTIANGKNPSGSQKFLFSVKPKIDSYIFRFRYL